MCGKASAVLICISTTDLPVHRWVYLTLVLRVFSSSISTVPCNQRYLRDRCQYCVVRRHSQEERLLRPELGWLGRRGRWTAAELASGADVGRRLGCAALAAAGVGICSRAGASNVKAFPDR